MDDWLAAPRRYEWKPPKKSRAAVISIKTPFTAQTRFGPPPNRCHPPPTTAAPTDSRTPRLPPYPLMRLPCLTRRAADFQSTSVTNKTYPDAVYTAAPRDSTLDLMRPHALTVFFGHQSSDPHIPFFPPPPPPRAKPTISQPDSPPDIDPMPRPMTFPACISAHGCLKIWRVTRDDDISSPAWHPISGRHLMSDEDSVMPHMASASSY